MSKPGKYSLLSLELRRLCRMTRSNQRMYCRRAIVQGQATDIVVRLTPGRAVLKEQDDVLSQQPLAASPHFFSLEAPNTTWHKIAPVPCKRSPAASVDPKPSVRSHVRMISMSSKGSCSAARGCIMWAMPVCMPWHRHDCKELHHILGKADAH